MCDDELGRGGDASGRGRAMGFCPSGPGSNLGQTKSFFLVHNCFQSILAGHRTISK